MIMKNTRLVIALADKYVIWDKNTKRQIFQLSENIKNEGKKVYWALNVPHSPL